MTTQRFEIPQPEEGSQDWTQDYYTFTSIVDQYLIKTGTLATRPGVALYENELYFARDINVLYRWDDNNATWIPVNRGTGEGDTTEDGYIIRNPDNQSMLRITEVSTNFDRGDVHVHDGDLYVDRSDRGIRGMTSSGNRVLELDGDGLTVDQTQRLSIESSGLSAEIVHDDTQGGTAGNPHADSAHVDDIPTTGDGLSSTSGVFSLDEAYAATWTALQTFNGGIAGLSVENLSDIEGSNLTVDATGVLNASTIDTSAAHTWTGEQTFDGGVGGLSTETLTNIEGDNLTVDAGGNLDAETQIAQDLIDSPNGHIQTVALEDTESSEISVPVGDTETLTVYRWGCWRIDQSDAPVGLDVELLDDADTTQASANTTNATNTAGVASHQNTSGTLSIFKLRVTNDTGATEEVGAIFGYEVS